MLVELSYLAKVYNIYIKICSFVERAQDHLKYVLGILGAHAMVAPSVRVERAPTKFDEAGRLTDEATIERLPKLLGALRDWTLRLQATAPGA
jgi:NAD(P)H-dependent FMN reductase